MIITTITKDMELIKQPQDIRYKFVKDMAADKVIGLIQYLYGCHRLYRDTILSEYWDLGIGLCRERLTLLGYKFISLRSGYPDIIQHPDGSMTKPVIE